ncbi:hypothetical protein H3C61_04420 [Candidatus Gracilibacteria bacterium]|nr:hypothetical protein [Candidatus Gracilibacteria bacterium]
MNKIKTKRIDSIVNSLDLGHSVDDILEKNATLEEIENIKQKISQIYNSEE